MWPHSHATWSAEFLSGLVKMPSKLIRLRVCSPHFPGTFSPFGYDLCRRVSRQIELVHFLCGAYKLRANWRWRWLARWDFVSYSHLGSMHFAKKLKYTCDYNYKSYELYHLIALSWHLQDCCKLFDIYFLYFRVFHGRLSGQSCVPFTSSVPAENHANCRTANVVAYILVVEPVAQWSRRAWCPAPLT